MTQGEEQPVTQTRGGPFDFRQTAAFRREDQRRSDALRAVRLGDSDAQSLAMQARGVVDGEDIGWGPDASKEDIDKWMEEERQNRDKALQAFKASLLEREIDAYLKGVDNATDRESNRAYNTRSIVLLLVVLAVVLMPIVAITTGLDPQSFGAYIAPVTGIAGTVVGYWFGTVERPTTRT